MVKRYDFSYDCGLTPDREENPDGDYVKHEDYEKLEKVVDAAKMYSDIASGKFTYADRQAQNVALGGLLKALLELEATNAPREEDTSTDKGGEA